ncbi:alpha/beta hydrolase fold having protein [Cystobacter fuscus DSM 2262]|uniref:Alpha/beta hydrolase fold having protein n=1 Tax=Cystobacter fuscus (strain ATCC 25194 / DSM 2262 / NBRC 100088 / M29) TaxID=1242864 RepID=S9Q3S6_CYSF2|nr:alpha/beta hydrolase [Cystobacter fuscus]EPX55964.1 alpha/beta hydrolase fold having protein [Cystobacter fuscus DSM 2262]
MSQNGLQFTDTRLGRLAYRVDGQRGGVPLVLLQRFRGTLDDWDPAFISALAAHRQVIRFDNAGIGGSSGQVPDSVEGMAEVAAAFIDALELTKVDLLGWSLGGIVAQQVALDRPQLVRRLVIAGSSPGGITDGPQAHPRVPEVMTRPVSSEEDFLFLFFTETDTGRAAGKASLARLGALQDKVPAVTKESFLRQVKALTQWKGTRARLGELKLPILVANGTSDVMLPAYRSYVISQEAPNAKLILYPDAGHGFLFQEIEDFTGQVTRFLA